MRQNPILALIIALFASLASAQFTPSQGAPQFATVLGTIRLPERPASVMPVTDSIGTPVGTLDQDGVVRLTFDGLAFPTGAWHSMNDWFAAVNRDCDASKLIVTRDTKYALVTSFKAGSVAFAARMALSSPVGGHVEETAFVYAEQDGDMIGSVKCGTTTVSYDLHFKQGWNQMVQLTPGPIQNLVKNPQWRMQPRTTPILFSLN
ncbi:hypothetical protein [Deinococcus soli (ex Cha et al. 2016)]|uniref:Uncharacterized protein n=2 Tax=Deinococcus soli (ex Cha et al. 2016) TaxID=1309411 RepID=A0AAE3XE90_9DEIO|nr:hypothetical protein [Deinococcus soli (ex Cha et al. 2016)]MDR6218897.1 hypothetical protein [Deinococcus soli (ex Cha et al. 2016)]MDR6328694.1 hypothetical protein [Deinococcus soli (ex Cha et al. 2016)]MDR6751819.1 hypothetical protein [Deinococcus soli (ex Cha et al. 2016)]